MSKIVSQLPPEMPRSNAGASQIIMRIALAILPRMAWVTFMILIIVWVMMVEGGLGFQATSPCVFGWHAVLMSAAFGVFMPEALLSFKCPLLPVSFFTASAEKQHSLAILWHAFCHIGTMTCSVLGIVAIYYYKSLTLAIQPSANYPVPPMQPPMAPMPMPDMPLAAMVMPDGPANLFPFYSLFSPHAWLGVAVLAAWLLQFIGGALSSLLNGSPEQKEQITNLHRFWGRCVFGVGLATCALGLQDMQSSDLATSPYAPNSLDAQLATAATLLAAAVAVLLFAADEFLPDVHVGRHRRTVS